MYTEISERDFLKLSGVPIQYIGIYELDWIVDDNLIWCEGIIAAFEDKKILITAKELGTENFDFRYFDFSQSYDCRKIMSSTEEPIFFVGKEVDADEDGISRYLRFKIGNRPILIVADKLVEIVLTHDGENGEWVEFENNVLLNDL